MNRRRKAQALVEFALILPILLFTILGGVEVGYLLITKAHQDRATAVVADWAASHPNSSWNAVANRELPGCDVEVTSIVPDLVQATSRCPYQPKTGLPMFDQIPISSRETALTRSSPPASSSPTPTTVASPS